MRRNGVRDIVAVLLRIQHDFLDFVFILSFGVQIEKASEHRTPSLRSLDKSPTMCICDEDGNTALLVTGLNECEHLITEFESRHQVEESTEEWLQRVFMRNFEGMEVWYCSWTHLEVADTVCSAASLSWNQSWRGTWRFASENYQGPCVRRHTYTFEERQLIDFGDLSLNIKSSGESQLSAQMSANQLHKRWLMQKYIEKFGLYFVIYVLGNLIIWLKYARRLLIFFWSGFWHCS